MRARAAWLVIAAACLLTALADQMPTAGWRAFTLDGTEVLAVAVAVVAVAWNRPTPRAPWVWIVVGLGLFVAGDVVWDFGWRTLGLTEAAVTPYADTLYLAGYLPITVGLALIARARSGGRDRAAFADGIIVAAAALAPAWQFLLQPLLRATETVTFDGVASVIYPFMDLILLAALVRVGFAGRHRVTALSLLTAGLVITLLGDIAYLRSLSVEVSWVDAIDLVWPVSYALVAASILHRSAREVGVPVEQAEARFGRGRVAVIGSALMVGPAVVIGAAGRVDPLMLGPVAIVVAGLVLWRLVGLAGATAAAQAAVRASETRFRSLVQHASDAIVVVGPDARLHYASPAITALLGGEPGSFVGRTLAELLHPDDLPAASAVVVEALAAPGTTGVLEARFRADDQTWRWIEARCTSHLDDPAVRGLVANLRDVSARRSDEELQAAEAVVLETIARGAPLEETLTALARTVEQLLTGTRVSIRVVDRETGALGVVAAPSISDRLLRWFDQRLTDPGPFVDGGWDAVREPEIVPDIAQDPRWESLRDGALAHGMRAAWVLPVRSSDGDRLLGAFTVYADEPRGPEPAEWRFVERSGHVAAIAIERAEASDRLGYLALHDPLTGLPNRTLVLDRLGHALAARDQVTAPLAVLFLDLDRFKVVNDSLGHDAGDELLVAVGRRLQEALRPGDTVARFGGDEFVVVCERVDDDEHAQAIAQRVARALAAPFALTRGEVVSSASIGIALSQRRGDTPESLLRDADAAMYRAKELGRSRHVLFDRALHTKAMRRLMTEQALRRALAEGELRVHYQPQIELATGRRTGVEALVRWAHPTRGLVGPADLIPVAEETGLIVPIGAWVLERACRDAAPRGLAVSVNLSPRQLLDPGLVDAVAATLAATGLPPEQLCLEVTESVLLDDATATTDVLDAIDALGVRLAIDDFGTGYSALSYLKRFPFDELKIDQTFVRGLGRDRADEAIVAATIAMAHALGMIVNAEGVETATQLEQLAVLGCDRAQGFHLARPAPIEDLGASPAPVARPVPAIGSRRT